MYSTIAFEEDERIGFLTLERPEKRNALNPTMRDELTELGDLIKRNENLRCLVVRGSGPSFSAGLDLDEGMADLLGDWAQDSNTDALLQKGLALASAFEWIPLLEIPSIAGVHGHAYGAGCQLALACDFRVITETARVGLVETRYGLMPDMGATFRLPRLVGDSVARRMVLLGEVLDGTEAARTGFADEVVPDKDLGATVLKLARELAAQPPLSLRGARRAMAASRTLPDELALEFAVVQQAACLQSAEFRTWLNQRR